MSFAVLIIIFLLIAMFVSAVYVLLLPGREERFLQYWAFSWIAYSFGILCIILFISRGSIKVLGIRAVFDMINILCLMFSVYGFSHVEIPKYWKYPALLLGLYGVFGIVAKLNLFMIFIPVSVFELACTIVILIIIFRFWEDRQKKIFTALLFTVWGVGKAAISIIELSDGIPDSIYLVEILFSNVLNYAIIIIFMHRSVELISRSERARVKMLSYISHELRIPITVILSYIDAIRDGVITDEKAIDTIFERTLMLDHLIDDLFALSMAENHQLEMNYSLNDALELSERFSKRFEEDVSPSGVTVRTHIDRESLNGLSVVVDEKRISQVISNLIVNAKKFSSKGDEVRVSFSADVKRKNYIVSVEDDGDGISDENLPYIFDQFFSKGNEEKGYSGSGIGLTLSKEIIESHKGTIRADSEYGKGSTFTFSLLLFEEE